MDDVVADRQLQGRRVALGLVQAAGAGAAEPPPEPAAEAAAAAPAGRRGGGAVALDQVIGDLTQETRRDPGPLRPEQAAPARVAEGQELAGPGETDVAEPALLLEVALVDRP